MVEFECVNESDARKNKNWTNAENKLEPQQMLNVAKVSDMCNVDLMEMGLHVGSF